MCASFRIGCRCDRRRSRLVFRVFIHLLITKMQTLPTTTLTTITILIITPITLLTLLITLTITLTILLPLLLTPIILGEFDLRWLPPLILSFRLHRGICFNQR